MNWFIENWSMIVISVIVLGVCGFAVWTKRANAKEWLKYAVLQAEKALGTKTGQAKLRMVYDMFVQQFPWFATFISFNTFSAWVDEAVKWLDNQIENNPQVKAFITGVTAVKKTAKKEQ